MSCYKELICGKWVKSPEILLWKILIAKKIAVKLRILLKKYFNLLVGVEKMQRKIPFLLFASSISLLLLGCKSTVETYVPQLKDVQILKPSEGETYYSNSLDTIKWSYPEIIESVDIQFTTDRTPFLTDIVMDTTIKSGEYYWDVPNEDNLYATLRLTVYSGKDKRVIEQNFKIKKGLTISAPKAFQEFSNPQKITVKWNSFGNYSSYKLYYSKFNVDRRSKWELIDENISADSRQYNWLNPIVYSNEVKLKLVALHDGQEAEVESDTVFTIHSDSLLAEERRFRRKLTVGDIWVYKVTLLYIWDIEPEEYYFVKKIIDNKIENGVTLFREITEKYSGLISIDSTWIESREAFTPTIILSDGDEWIKESPDYFETLKCSKNLEQVLGMEKMVKKFYWSASGSGISNENYSYAIDFGKVSDFSTMEGSTALTQLVGVLMDGVVYGDTSIVR